MADEVLANTIDIVSPEGLRNLADGVQRFLYKYDDLQAEEFDDLLHVIRRHANQISAEREEEQRKITQLTSFIRNAVPDWQIDLNSAGKVAAALLGKFDMEFKDKSGPSLGEDYDPDDYK